MKKLNTGLLSYFAVVLLFVTGIANADRPQCDGSPLTNGICISATNTWWVFDDPNSDRDFYVEIHSTNSGDFLMQHAKGVDKVHAQELETYFDSYDETGQLIVGTTKINLNLTVIQDVSGNFSRFSCPSLISASGVGVGEIDGKSYEVNATYHSLRNNKTGGCRLKTREVEIIELN